MLDSSAVRPQNGGHGSKRPPRVLVVSQLPPPFHGSAVMTKTFLDALDRIGIAYRLVDRRFSRSIDEIGAPTGRKILRAAALATQLARIATSKSFDFAVYFVATNLSALAVDAVMLRVLRARGLPCWLYFHGKGYKEVAKRGSTAARVVEVALTTASGGVVLSNRLIPDVEPWIPRDRILVIANAIADVESSHDRFSMREDGCRFLYLSNLIPSKGALEFIEAATIVARQDPHATFSIFGEVQDGNFVARIDDRATELGGRLTRGGGIYGDEKRRAFRNSDVFVFPTYYEFETFGLVNLEAMREGLPVIATDVGGIPDVVLDGVTGQIVSPRDVPALADAMLRFAASPQERSRMGEAGRRRFLEKFTLGAYDTAWREALRRMIHEARRG